MPAENGDLFREVLGHERASGPPSRVTMVPNRFSNSSPIHAGGMLNAQRLPSPDARHTIRLPPGSIRRTKTRIPGETSVLCPTPVLIT